MVIKRRNSNYRNNKKKLKNIKRAIPLISICIMTITFGFMVHQSNVPLSVESVLAYTPSDPVLAGIALMLFFALKSFTIILPISVLYLTSGVLFSSKIAILVSTVGLTVTISLPYWIGRYSGEETVKEICAKYPKANQIAVYQQENKFFACFITRIVGFLPGDIVSLYFGSCRIKYSIYLIAGVSGSMFSIITTTLLGTKLSNPRSIEFLIVLICRIMVSIGAIVLQHLFKIQKEKSE